MEEGFETF